MTPLGLRGRFLVAGVLLVATTAASSAWSAWAFRRVSLVVDATVRDSEQTTEATGSLATDLEREDDALLLTLADPARGRTELASTRATVAHALARVDGLLTSPGERRTADALRRNIEAYVAAGDRLVERAGEQDARIRYHEDVNPLLRRAVADAAEIRDAHFRSTLEVAAWARDQAARATQILAGVFGAALLLSLLVALYLARVVVLPIGQLMRAVEALRRGDFARRVVVQRGDELGQLAAGFNRMADDLAEFRRANIGEVVRAKETLEATLAALPDAVVVIEPHGEVSSANPRASEVMRAAGSEAIGALHDLPLPEWARDAAGAVLRGERPPLAVDLSKALTMTIGGEARRLLPRVVPIEGRGAVLLLSDVTELVRLDEMRMELVAVASHELRTPLTTLRMTLLMLKERAARLEGRDRELVETALVGVEQLGAIVGEFLDLTRIEAGQLRLHCDRLDVASLVERAVDAVKAACLDAGVSLRVATDPRTPLSLWGDAARLNVVLANVLGNAAKYTPAGGTIDVTVHGSDEGARARIEVTDSGPGIPHDLRERIFDKFFRVEHHRQDAEQGVRGSGIGLYIAREIVEAHRGTIECQGGPGDRGARFVIVIPVEPPDGDGGASA
jgi:NtrC-family two-component system sensor histidine kinase KinB